VGEDVNNPRQSDFLPTESLRAMLAAREEEPWGAMDHGRTITARQLAEMLGDFNIRPERDRAQTCRGYYRHRFTDMWERYLQDTGEEED
jgi:hypothetical protein